MCESKVVVFVSLVGMSREKLLMVSRPRESGVESDGPRIGKVGSVRYAHHKSATLASYMLRAFYVINLTFSQSYYVLHIVK
jgi:hypothetical protein